MQNCPRPSQNDVCALGSMASSLQPHPGVCTHVPSPLASDGGSSQWLHLLPPDCQLPVLQLCPLPKLLRPVTLWPLATSLNSPQNEGTSFYFQVPQSSVGTLPWPRRIQLSSRVRNAQLLSLLLFPSASHAPSQCSPGPRNFLRGRGCR